MFPYFLPRSERTLPFFPTHHTTLSRAIHEKVPKIAYFVKQIRDTHITDGISRRGPPVCPHLYAAQLYRASGLKPGKNDVKRPEIHPCYTHECCREQAYPSGEKLTAMNHDVPLFKAIIPVHITIAAVGMCRQLPSWSYYVLSHFRNQRSENISCASSRAGCTLSS